MTELQIKLTILSMLTEGDTETAYQDILEGAKEIHAWVMEGVKVEGSDNVSQLHPVN